MQALASECTVQNGPEALEALHTLHPARQETLPKPTKSDIQGRAKISGKALKEAMQDLKNGKTPGLSGWRNEHLKAFQAQADEWQMTRYLEWANGIFEKLATYEKAPLASLLIALSKPGKPEHEVRPIAIGEVLLACPEKALVKQLSSRIANSLSPFSFGVGVPGGPEAMAVSTMLLNRLHPKKAILKIDVKNAFNTISRTAQLRGIREFCPELAAPFLWTHGHSLTLRTKGADARWHVVESLTGTRQGGPTGGPNYTMGAESANRELRKRILDRDPTGALLTIHDDGVIITEVSQVARAYQDAVSLFRQIGCEVGPHSTILLPKGAQPTVAIKELGIQVTHEGIMQAGIPIGTPEYVRAHLEEKQVQFKNTLERIERLPTVQLKTLVARYCVPGTLTHLCRTLPPEQTATLARTTDIAFRAFFAKLVNEPKEGVNPVIPDAAWTQARLPIRLAGMGLTTMIWIAPQAFAAGFASSLQYIRRNKILSDADMQEVAKRSKLDSPDMLWRSMATADRDLANAYEDEYNLFNNSVRDAPKKIQHQLSTKVYGEKYFDLYSGLEEDHQMRLIACRASEAGRWLYAIPSTRALTMDNDSFSNRLASRLGMRPPGFSVDTCPGTGNRCNAAPMSGYHMLRCAPVVAFRSRGTTIPGTGSPGSSRRSMAFPPRSSPVCSMCQATPTVTSKHQELDQATGTL